MVQIKLIKQRLSKIDVRTWRIIAGASVVILILVGMLFWPNIKDLINSVQGITVRNISVDFYLSQSSRDENKIKQSEFKIGEPIQAQIDFENAQDKTIVQATLRNSEKNDVLMTLDVPITGTGHRFLTIPQSLAKMEGKYTLTIGQNGKTLTSAKFTITNP